MNKIFRYLMALSMMCTTPFFAYAQKFFTLDDIITRARGESPFARQAETLKENRYWAYRFYRSNYNPQLELNGRLPVYSRSVTQVPQQDGSFVYVPVEQTVNFLQLALVQPLALTGGTISANSSLDYFRDFRDNTTNGEQWGGSIFNIALSQPLFAFNRLRWDRKTEPIRYEESKREFAEQLEGMSSEASSRFFNVLQAQINLQIAKFNLANNDTIYKIEEGRYNIGTTSLDKLLQVELQLLNSRQDVGRANLELETARLQLRSYIGIKDGEEFDLLLPEVIPQFDVTVDEALDYARKNRAAFVAFQRRRIEAEREVARAKGNRFETTMTAAYGLNNTGLVLNDVYQDPQQQQQFSLTFSVPVLNWGRNQAQMKTAIANKKYNDYLIEQDEVNFEQEVLTKVRQFEMLRLQIEITRKSDEVASERYNVAQNRYLIGKIDITNLNIALKEKDEAKRNYILALKSFWTAYYDLRRLTLYDFWKKTPLYTQVD